MLKFILICLFIVYTVGQDKYLTTQPSYLKPCRIKDPNFIACSTESIQGLFTHLATNSIEGLDTLKTIDPLKLNKIKILQGDGPVSVNASLSKVVVTGFGKTKIVESKVSPKDYSWETKISLPIMKLEGQYNMRGRILVIPLNGHGKCWFEPYNLNILLFTKTRLYEKGGHTFYNVTNTKVNFELNGLKLHMDNLFDGVKALEESTNQYLNENWRPVSDALKPIITKTIEDILLDLLQKIFHHIPADFFVTDIPTPKQLYGDKA